MAGRITELSTPTSDAEVARYLYLLDHAFSDRPQAEPRPDWVDKLGRDTVRLVKADGGKGEVIAGVNYLPMGQWFGGRSVPCVGIAAVVVAPEHRGSGVGSGMMRAALIEMRAMGYAISTLYASSQGVYRRVGYEQAGHCIRYRIPIHSLPARQSLQSGDDALTVRAFSETEAPLLHRLYAVRARQTNGQLDRHPYFWDGILDSKHVPNRYLVERDGMPEGYVVYFQGKEPGGKDRELFARDLVAITPAAGRRLLAFLADHRRVGDTLSWHGTPADSLFLQLPEQDYSVVYLDQWLIRIIDVPAALTARGYPAGVTAELHLEVRDELFPENAGRFIFTVANGRAEGHPGGEGRITLDIRGLSAIYTSFLPPAAVQTAGLLDGPDEDLALLASVFAGPAPWMPDHF